MLTHSDQFTPDTMIATSNVRYEGVSPNETWATLLGVTVNASYPTQSHRSQNWGDADGSLSRTGRPTQLGCSRAQTGWWWRLDEKCARKDEWTMWACDSPPTRSSGMVFLGFNASRQSTPFLGDAECSNGDYTTVPCEPVARVTHLGYPFSLGNDVSANARVSGPTGGFGWAFAWTWQASVARGFAPAGLTDNPPVTLTLGLPQVEPDKVLLLAFPYPRDAAFRVTMYSNAGYAPPAALPRFCAPASNLCAWNFSAAGSVAEVREAPNADRFFFDRATGHLYVRMTVQLGWSTMGVQNTSAPRANPAWIFTVPPARGWTRGGLSLPPRGTNALQIVATSCGAGGLHESGAYCATSNGGAEPASPCPGARLPLAAFDSCGAPAAGGGAAPGGAAGALAGAAAGWLAATALLAALAAGAAIRWRATAAARRAGVKGVVATPPPGAARLRSRQPSAVRAVIEHTMPAPLQGRRQRKA